MMEKQRQQLILDILDESRFASVRRLSAELNASEASIRRDLTKLANQKKLKKIHGGAEAIAEPDKRSRKTRLKGSTFWVDIEKHAVAKRLIAQRAVQICEDGDTIIINGGSSTYMMAEFLADRHMKILTNSFVLAYELQACSDNQITIPGGEIYRAQGIVLSAFDNDTIQHYHGSKMFMGTPGIGEYGVMESDTLLIRAEQKLRKQADQLIILADSSKLGQKSNLIFAPLSEVDVLITDSNADNGLLEFFKAKGIEVIVVDVPPEAEAAAMTATADP